MNPHNQHFNRTTQANFTDYHEELLFSGLPCFIHNRINRKMADWLVDYNPKIPYHSLELRSPIQSHIWGTYTDMKTPTQGVLRLPFTCYT